MSSPKPIKKFRKMLERHNAGIEDILNQADWIPDFVEEYCRYNPEQRESVVQTYRDWLETAVAWRDNRKNPVLSFLFLDGHPCFWSFEHKGSEGQSFEGFLTGNTLVMDGAASTFWKDADYESKYMMECGNAVPPYRLHHYHDYNLDAYGNSFEECFVDTAKYTFGLNGFAVVDIEQGLDFQNQRLHLGLNSYRVVALEENTLYEFKGMNKNMANTDEFASITTQNLATALLGWLEHVAPELAKVVAENPAEHVQDILDMAREVRFASQFSQPQVVVIKITAIWGFYFQSRFQLTCLL